MKDNKKGFTLIELLAVIAILAILMLLVTPRLVKSIKSSKKDTFYDNVTLIYNTAILEYVDDNAKNDEYCDTCSNNLGNKIPNKFEYNVKFEEDKLIYIKITDKEYIYVKSDKNGINKKDLSKDDVKEYDPNVPEEREEFKGGTLSEAIMYNNPTISTRTDFSSVFTETNTGTLYKATESIASSTPKDVYYFAGNATNNWVKFAGFYWRIIRTNHDGSIRLLYSGTRPDTTEGYIGRSTFNSLSDDPMYVGYMYGTDGTLASNRTNETDSAIKTYIDNWYGNNLSSYTKYISTEAVYCNDRKAPSYNASSSFNYYVYTRLNAGNPTYDCEDSKDAFSGSNSEAKLTYPIGLMTADEINIAGGLAYNNARAYYYLNSAGRSITGNQWWWSLSPVSWSGRSNVWNVGGSDGPGYLSSYNVNNSRGVRPAISLKSCVKWKSGDGSANNPYEILENGGC